MSFEKISTILENKSIIDINLISDSLKSTLEQIIDLIANQETKMKDLEQKLSEKAESTDIQVINAHLNEYSMEKINELIEKSQLSYSSKLAALESQIKDTQHQFDQTLDAKFWEKDAEYQKQFNHFDEEIEIINQKSNTILKTFGEMHTKIDNANNEITTIKERVEHLENESDSTLSSLIEKIQHNIKEFEETVDKNNESLRDEINEMKQSIAKTNSHNEDEFEKIRGRLIEMNAKLDNDNNELEIDTSQPIDVPSIMRAIQRNSRRIDAMNEIVQKSKQESSENSKFFSGLHSCLNDIGYTVTQLSEDVNDIKTNLPQWIESKVGSANAMSDLVNDLAQRFKDSEEMSSAAFNDLNAAMNHLYSHFKTKMPNETSTGVIDAISVCQRNATDMKHFVKSISQNVSKDSEMNDLFKPKKIPKILIPTLPTEDKSEKEEIQENQNKFEAEFREKFEELSKQFNEEREQNKENNERLTMEIDKKADTYYLERMIDKLKNLINHVNTQASEKARALSPPPQYRYTSSQISSNNISHGGGGGVQKPHKTNENMDTSYVPQKPHKTHNNMDGIHGDRITHQRSLTKAYKMNQSVLGKPLPPLPTSAQAYDVIYNQKRVQRYED